MSEFFALCVHRYRGPDNNHLRCYPGELLYVHRVEASGWVGATQSEGRWGWVPWAYVQQVDEEVVAVLLPIADELRLGAYRAMTALHAHSTTEAGYSSPDSNESDVLGDDWGVVAPKQRRPSRAAREPPARPSLDSEPPTPRPPSPSQPNPDHVATTSPGVQFTLATDSQSRPRVPLVTSVSPSSFVPPRVRGFRLRSKSNDRDVRSDSESTNRPRRPSVSLRRNRISMFGPVRGLEPHPAEEIARLAARPLYLQPTHRPATGDIVIDHDGSIRAGTLEAIAERLTCDPPSRSYEYAFRRAVLLTYEAFTSSQQLFELVTDQYSLEPARELTEEQFVEWKESRLRPTQARVLEVLGMWLALPRLYIDDPGIVLRIREFLRFVNGPDNLAAEARVHLKTIDKLISPPTIPRPTTSPRRKTSKHRPFPVLSPNLGSTSSSSSLLTPSSPRPGSASPRVSSASARQSSPSPHALVETPSVNQRLEVPLQSPASATFPAELGQENNKDKGPVRAKSQRQTGRSQHAGSASSHHTSYSHHTQGSSSHSHAYSSAPQPSGILSLDPTALAHHLTLLETALYMRVKRIQCLEWHQAGKTVSEKDKRSRMSGSSFMSHDRSADAATVVTNTANITETTVVDVNDLREFCATSDQLAGWVKWSVLSLKSAIHRAEAVGLWIRVAEKCRQLHNTSSLCAIVAGLTSSDISRLTVTWQLVPSSRTQRLEDLARVTSPAGSFAALKVTYASAEGPGVPFVGMYLTGLVHAADQFKDLIPIPSVEDEQRRKSGEAGAGREGLLREPPTPTQAASSSTDAPLSQGRMTTTRMLLNFTKRHKQADIIGMMLKFQQWPYTVVPAPGEPTPTSPRQTHSSPPNTHLSPSTSPATNSTSAIPPASASATVSLYPYTPSSASASTPLYASAGGVAWIQEQLMRAARITLGSDWPYERSMRLHDEEVGWSGVKDILGDAGF